MRVFAVLRSAFLRRRRMSDPSDMLSFFSIVGRLKNTKRTGWVVRGVQNSESVSDHMYRMSIMAMMICDTSLRKDHCIKLCLVHDMAECIVGDYTPHDNIPKERKQREELSAMRHLSSFLSPPNADELKSLFQEYEDQKTPESHFVKDLDKLDMVLQAYDYENQAQKPGWLQEFFDSTEGKFKTDIVQKLYESLKERRASPQAGDDPLVTQS